MLYSYKLYPHLCINLNIAVAHGYRRERDIGLLFLQVKKIREVKINDCPKSFNHQMAKPELKLRRSGTEPLPFLIYYITCQLVCLTRISRKIQPLE